MTFLGRVDIIRVNQDVTEGKAVLDVELERFAELERRIRAIVEEHATLKNRIRELESLLEENNARLEETNGVVQVLNGQKDAVRTRVDVLLDMLRDMEVS
ncbi:MAG: hypothetical protein PHY29_09520 [Syntrophales bacterium]|nr:hypothetical protein [Syntrophales bacterium]